MQSASSRFVVAFNGEIYNHIALRHAVDASGCGQAWRGHSDTETLLAGFELWGFEATLKKANGMFAVALWDRQNRLLHLARDRMGEKPLYYGWQNGVFLFGSELRALKTHPGFIASIDRDALALQLRHNYIPAPFSIYKNIFKLPAGSTITINSARVGSKPIAYWSLAEVARRGLATPFKGSPAELTGALDMQLRDAVSAQLMSDVPVGAFLSGGIDSSLVVALMQAQSNMPVKTFTIGFSESGYDEAPYAKAVAKHLGTEHTELYVSPQQALEVIPKLPRLYDEPFSDASQIPTFLLAQMTRQHVTVALSGDGGDELFGGYSRYRLASSIWNKTERMPTVVKQIFVQGMQCLSSAQWDALAQPFMRLLPRSFKHKSVGDRMHKLAALLGHSDPHWLYRDLVSHWKDPSLIVLHSTEPPIAMTLPGLSPSRYPFERHMMYLDAMSYLPDDILVKVDRAAMGVSLETRVPLLSHHLVEFSWQLPLPVLIREGQGKWILKKVLERYVPKPLFERPKKGFGVPLAQWLRGPLRDWAEAMLSTERLRREGFFDAAPIRKKWDEHLAGSRNWQSDLWTVLMFQAWWAEQ